MDPQSDEDTIRKLLQRMKAEDQQQLTSFDDLLLRQARVVVNARPSRHRWVIAACSAAAALLVGFVLFFGDWSDSDRDPRGVLARESPVVETHPVHLDFTALRGAIDQYFDPATVPEWKTPSDSLLAMDFNVSFSQE